jgi:hypothetical protein
MYLEGENGYSFCGDTTWMICFPVSISNTRSLLAKANGI